MFWKCSETPKFQVAGRKADRDEVAADKAQSKEKKNQT